MLLWTLKALLALPALSRGVRTKCKLSALSLGLFAVHLLPGVAQAAKSESIMARLKSAKAIEGGISSRAHRPESSVSQSISLHSSCTRYSGVYSCLFGQCWAGNCYGESNFECVCNSNYCWDDCGGYTCVPNWCNSCGAGQYRDSCNPGTCSAPNGDGCSSCPENTYKDWVGAGACAPCGGCPPGEFRAQCGGSSPGQCFTVSIILR